jgi:hypothetical protein
MAVMNRDGADYTSPPAERGEREGPAPKAREGEVGGRDRGDVSDETRQQEAIVLQK